MDGERWVVCGSREANWQMRCGEGWVRDGDGQAVNEADGGELQRGGEVAYAMAGSCHWIGISVLDTGRGVGLSSVFAGL